MRFALGDGTLFSFQARLTKLQFELGYSSQRGEQKLLGYLRLNHLPKSVTRERAKLGRKSMKAAMDA